MFGSNKFLRAILFVAMMAEFTCHAQSRYQFQHFDTRDGLMDDFVWSIAQDSLGYMWFQYFAGLTRFDGYNFKVYKYDKDDSLRSALDFLLGTIEVDRNKNIRIIKHGHPPKPLAFARYDRKVDGFIKFTSDVDLTAVYKFRVDEPTGAIWLSMRDGKGLSALDMKTNQITSYLNPSSHKDTYTKQNTVLDSEDMGSSILLATENGLWSFDKTTKTFSRPNCPARDSAFLYHTMFFHIGPKKQLWLGKPGAFVKLGPDLSVEESLDLPPDFNFTRFSIDSEGIFWFGTWSQGLYRADPKNDVFVNIVNVPGDPYSLKSNRVYDVRVDRDQNVWVATGKGLSRIPGKNMASVNLLSHNLGEDATAGTYKTGSSEFLVTSKRLSQNSWEILMGEVPLRQLNQIQFKRLATVDAGFISVFLQGRRYFWVCDAWKGIFGFPINPTTAAIETSRPFVIHHDPANPNTVNTAGIGTMWEDDEENLWVGGNGLIKINLRIPYGEKGSVTIYDHQDSDTSSISSNVIYQIYPEDHASLWVVTEKSVDLFHCQTGKFERIFKDREGPNNVFKTSDGTLFLGTLKGLYEAKKINGGYRFDGPPIWDRSEVKGIQEDKLGRLWLRTSIGIICYDRQSKTALEFNEGDGLLHYKHYQIGYLHQTSDGRIFTVDDGITLFDPVSLELDTQKTIPILTRLEVNNKRPKVKRSSIKEADDFFLDEDISVLDELTIDYRHNNFTIEFSSMEMAAPEKNLYRHKLEGYDNDWIETDFRNRTATYTNLDAGHYTFKVKASNHHGVWSDQETTLSVVVLPPPWRSSWAYTGYGLIFVGLLFLARRNIVQRERLKSNLKLAKVEQEKEHFELEKAIEVDKVKSTFFANISHEFRTPLTLIKGPVQNLLEQFADHPNVKEQLKLVQRNSDVLLKLINQLLDLAKLDSGNLKVEKTDNDLNSFLTAVINSFSSLAFQKSIALDMELPSIRHVARFDKDKVETILINLINNAVKFTPSGGTVTVRTDVKSLSGNVEPNTAGTPLGAGLPAAAPTRRGKAGGLLTITVSDTGIGIPLDQQSKIFERFHQVSEAHREVGTGIGLALVKELVTLMEGFLILKSESGNGLPGEQTGSEFTVTLPIEVIRVLSETEHVVNFKEQVIREESTLKENGHELGQDTRPRILVVEDNDDLRRFIVDCLGKEFQFLEAADGKQGMEAAFEETPDLIISDVMMPEMDGITMTGKLKKDTRTSHIPLLLLTAKTSDESKLSGLGTGADDYLTKPFNKNELLLKVRNSIAMRIKLREKIKLELLKESPNVEVQSEDEQFLYKIRETILSRLSDEQLSVESLAEEVNLSRSQLLRKITALTGTSVNELIRTFRLQKAAQLLEQNWGPVTQIAYEVGFSNLSYFSKVFKEQYGVLPSEYQVTKVK